MKLSKLYIPLMGLALFATSASFAFAAITPAEAANKMEMLRDKITTIESRFIHVRDLLIARNVDVTAINNEIPNVEAKKALVVADVTAFKAIYAADPTGWQQDAAKRAALHNAAEKTKTDLEAFIAELKIMRGIIASVLQANGYNTNQ